MEKMDSYIPNLVSVLCPTRGRAQQLEVMIKSCLAMAQDPDLIEFCLYIDRDDISYDIDKIRKITPNVKFIHGPRMSLSSMFNSLLTVARGEFFFWSGDDVNFQTYNWDFILKSQLVEIPDHLGVSHANDMAAYEQKYATNGMVHYNWIILFGHLFTPYMKDNGIDFWISDVAKRANRLFYCSQVKIEHLQYRQGKSHMDATYKARRKSHESYDLIELYRNGKSERRRDLLILLQKIEQAPKIQSGFLLSGVWTFIKLNRDIDFILSSRFIYMNSMLDSTIIRKVLRRLFLIPPANIK